MWRVLVSLIVTRFGLIRNLITRLLSFAFFTRCVDNNNKGILNTHTTTFDGMLTAFSHWMKG